MRDESMPEKRQSILKDIFGVITFIILVIAGVIIINNFIFRSFNVEGPSMEKTLYTGDKLIVNKIPVTLSSVQGKAYLPQRGEVIVFKNPLFDSMGRDEYLVKRVIGLPGDKVVVKDGALTVFNTKNPKGFNPDNRTKDNEGSPTSGDIVKTVPRGELFVSGDHREGNFSYDSRNGLSTIPLKYVEGPVGLRIFPFQNFRSF